MHCAMHLLGLNAVSLEFLDKGNHRFNADFKRQRLLFQRTPDFYPYRYEAPVGCD